MYIFINSTIKIQLCSKGQQKPSFKLCSKQSTQKNRLLMSYVKNLCTIG